MYLCRNWVNVSPCGYLGIFWFFNSCMNFSSAGGLDLSLNDPSWTLPRTMNNTQHHCERFTWLQPIRSKRCLLVKCISQPSFQPKSTFLQRMSCFHLGSCVCIREKNTSVGFSAIFYLHEILQIRIQYINLTLVSNDFHTYTCYR